MYTFIACLSRRIQTKHFRELQGNSMHAYPQRQYANHDKFMVAAGMSYGLAANPHPHPNSCREVMSILVRAQGKGSGKCLALS